MPGDRPVGGCASAILSSQQVAQGWKRLTANLVGVQACKYLLARVSTIAARPRFWSVAPPTKRNKGKNMKRLSTALALTALLALGACGSRTANNAAAIDTSNDVYNVSPDDLTVNDLGNASNASSGNSSSGGNASSSANSSASNTSGNSH
jgi:hypothetical protein